MNAFAKLGMYVSLLYEALQAIFEVKTYRSNFVDELVKIGYESVPIVLLTGAFTGAVMTLQTAYQFVSAIIPKSIIGSIVVQSVVIELAAVVTSLVLSGKVGARIATELGTMRVSEQIDALESMGFNSVAFLVVPRVLAALVMFPVLYIIATIIAIMGGIFAAVLSGALPVSDFLLGARTTFYPANILFGLLKAFVFGFVITSVSCFYGYNASGGAEGVGTATTHATVMSCIYVLFADFLLAAIVL